MNPWKFSAVCLFAFEVACASPATTRQGTDKATVHAPEKATPPRPAVSLLELNAEWRAHVAEGRATLLGSHGKVTPDPYADKRQEADEGEEEEEEDGWEEGEVPDEGEGEDGWEDWGAETQCAEEQPERLRISLRLGLLDAQDKKESRAVAWEDDETPGPEQELEFQTPEACQRFMARVANASPRKQFGSADFPVTVSLGQVQSKGRVVFATSAEYCKYLICDGDYVEQSSEVWTILGPLVTIVTHASSVDGDSAPFHQQTWHSIDLRTGKKASVLDFVEEAALVAAIKKDEDLAFALAEYDVAIADLNTWSQINEAIEPTDYARYEGFAFAQGKTQSGLVALLLAFDEGGLDHRTLELKIPGRSEVLKYFEAAHHPRFAGERGPHIEGVSYAD